MKMKIELSQKEVKQIIADWVRKNCLPPASTLDVKSVEIGSSYSRNGAEIEVEEPTAEIETVRRTRAREPLEIEIIDAPRPE